jgi:hypothetical protein
MPGATVSVAGATYDGSPHGGTASVTGPAGLNQSLTVTYAGRNTTSYGPSTTPPTNAGDYTASASYAGDANYLPSSDSEAYRRIVHGNTGFLCGDSADEWHAALAALIRNADLRASIGRAAQEEVRSRWMLAPNAHRWLDAYSAALVATPGREGARC